MEKNYKKCKKTNFFDKIYKNKEIHLPLYIKAYTINNNQLEQLIYSYSHNNNEQFEDLITNINEISYLNDKNIISIESGGSHHLALSYNGNIYSWGSNVCGQLGFYDQEENLDISKDNSQSPILLKNLENIKIKIISCGEVHSLALSENGDIYSWGGCSYGQLGHSYIDIMPKDDNNKPFLPIPNIIESIREIKMIDIACGKYHNISIDNNGNIYSWGNGTYGQLGIGKNINELSKNEDGFYYQAIPYKLKDLKDKNIYIMKAACGNDHSLILSTEGKIYSFGANNYRQLGLDNNLNININISDNIPYVDIPTCVEGIITDKIITYISCGNYSCMVLDSNNNLYGWGLSKEKKDEFNMNNIGDKNKIISENEYINGQTVINTGIYGKVDKVWCDNYHCIALNKDNIPFSFGFKNYITSKFFTYTIGYNFNNISLGNKSCIISAYMNNNKILNQYIYYFFKEGLYTDISIFYKDHEIKCHKSILMMSSELLSKRITNETKKIIININELDVEYYIFLTIIQYMYLKIDEFIFQCENIDELISYSKVIKYLKINELIEQVQKILSKNIQNLNNINLTHFNLFGANTNINNNEADDKIKNRTLVGLDGKIYFLLNDNIIQSIKDNSIQISISDNNNNYEYCDI